MPQITQLPDIFGSQLFWLLLIFGFIFFVIARGMLPRIMSTPKIRAAKIADDLARAQSDRDRADRLEAEWRERMDAARIDAAQVAREARSASARDSEARLRSALQRIDDKSDLASRRIREAVAAARAEVEAAAVDAAQQIVEQLTGIKVDRKAAAEAVAAEFVLAGEMLSSGEREPVAPKRTARGARK